MKWEGKVLGDGVVRGLLEEIFEVQIGASLLIMKFVFKITIPEHTSKWASFRILLELLYGFCFQSQCMNSIKKSRLGKQTNEKNIGDGGFVHSSRDHIKIEKETQSKQQVKWPGI